MKSLRNLLPLVFLGSLWILPALNQNLTQSRSTLIVGHWDRNVWDLYMTAEFQQDSTVVFDNHIDTLYRFRYAFDEDSLRFSAVDGSEITTRVIKLTNDSLCLSAIAPLRSPLRFVRSRK